MTRKLNNIPGYTEICLDVAHYPDTKSQHNFTMCLSNFPIVYKLNGFTKKIAFPVRNNFCIYLLDSYTALINCHLNESPYTEIFLKAKSTDGRCQNVIKLKYKQFFL